MVFFYGNYYTLCLKLLRRYKKFFIKAWVIKTLLFFLLPIASPAQIIYSGIIIEKFSKEPIPFVSISLMKANTGINADSLGRFSFTAKAFNEDTLIFSSIGYLKLRLPVKDFANDLNIEMDKTETILREVTIERNNELSALLNDYGSCGINYYTTSGLITQLAQYFQSPSANATLSKIYVCKSGSNARFRIRIYKEDSITGRPSYDLADTIIEVFSNRRHVEVDVEKMKIYLPEGGFFIAIEWLFIPYNEIKIHKQNRHKQYSPFVSIKLKKSFDLYPPVLQLNRQGQWRTNDYTSRILISAKLKY